MEPIETLKAARELISDPARHTTGALARNAAGHICDPNSSNAVRFCALGAIRRAAKAERLPICPGTSELLQAAKEMNHFWSPGVVEINDFGTHADVLTMFDRAIALAENEVRP